MGIIRKTIYTGVLTGLGVAGYLGASTTLARPLPLDDPLFSSKIYSQYNKHSNGSAQDIVVKRIPLSKIRPELLQNEGDLAIEFCRGVWSGLGMLSSSMAFRRTQNLSRKSQIFRTNRPCKNPRLPLPTRLPSAQIPRPRDGIAALDGPAARAVDVRRGHAADGPL
jgi:hypothetical protein